MERVTYKAIEWEKPADETWLLSEFKNAILISFFWNINIFSLDFDWDL